MLINRGIPRRPTASRFQWIAFAQKGLELGGGIGEPFRYDPRKMLQILRAHDWCRSVGFEVIRGSGDAPDAFVINWRGHVLVELAEELGDFVVVNFLGMQLVPYTGEDPEDADVSEEGVLP